MNNEPDFIEKLQTALEEKTAWFNTSQLPEMLDNYRLLHTCIKSLYDILIQHSLITPDPYKLDKKISDITIPEDGPYMENERAVVIGARFSDYESMLDFLCTYYKFSVDHINITEIKKMTDLNNAFQWDNFSPNSAKTNTRGLAILVNEVRQHTTAMSLSTINDSISKSGQAISRITAILRELTEFQREIYKGQLRKDLFDHPSFNKQKAYSSPVDELNEIKRLYPEVMGKKPFYSDLVTEIIREDQGSDKLQLQQAVIQKLEVKANRSVSSKKKVDTKEMLMAAVLTIASVAPQYAQIIEKLKANNDILNTEQDTFIEKVKTFLRKTFNVSPKPIEYTLVIVDPKTETQNIQKIEFGTFMKNLEHHEIFFLSFAGKKTTEYRKIESSSEETILNFVSKQISDCQEFLILLAAFDDFFKTEAAPQDKSKIKGLKIELVTLKNILIKANQKRAEYSSYIEEETQMKKLGIQDV
jgi:hypothetical protein